MKQIPLSRGLFAIVDNEDFYNLSLFKWHAQEGHNGIFYARRHLKNGRTEFMHWAILGKPLKGFYIDHKNGNALDNRRFNLRICTPSQNHHNKSSMQRKNRTSQFKGVRFRNGTRICPWYAYIKANGKRYFHLGSFKTETEAAKAYNEAALKEFGKFARLNNIPQST